MLHTAGRALAADVATSCSPPRTSAFAAGCVAATAESRAACLSVAGGYMSEHTFVAARSRLPGTSSIDNVTAIDCMAVPRRSAEAGLALRTLKS